MTDRVYLGVAALVWRDRQLLLGERIDVAGDSCWQFPGGHLEPGETVTECAVRETLEETGIQLHRPRCVSYTNKPFLSGQRLYHTLYVSGECDQHASALLKEPDKCRQWCWFSPAELPHPLFRPIELLLEQLSEQQSVLSDIRE